MAKKSKLAKANKQQALIETYRGQRAALKAAGDVEGLRNLPKDSHPNHHRKRDLLDGRPNGYMSKFQLSRINFRQLAHKGLIPGVKKASW